MSYDYALDTYAWIEFFNGTARGKMVKRCLETGNVVTSVIALAELADKCAREGHVLEPLATFIRENARILPLTEDVAMKSGELKKQLRKKAKDIGLADAIHLQTARSVSAVFVTGDADFKHVKRSEGSEIRFLA